MPLWAYHVSPLSMALLMVISVEAVAIVGLLLVRRCAVPHIRFNERINDAISGIVATIGVFYGVTVGLLAVEVWNTWASAAELVSKGAAAIGAVYHDVSSYPSPIRQKLQSGLQEYAHIVVEQGGTAQKKKGASWALTSACWTTSSPSCMPLSHPRRARPRCTPKRCPPPTS